MDPFEWAGSQEADAAASTLSPTAIPQSPPPPPVEQPLDPHLRSGASELESPDGHTSTPSATDKLWTFLHRCNVAKLRDFQRVLRLRRSKLKMGMMKRVLKHSVESFIDGSEDILGCTVPE